MKSDSAQAVLRLLSDSDQTISDADEDIRARTVIDSDGQALGKIEDLLIDDVEKKVRFLLVEHGGIVGFGRTRSFVPVDDIVAITDHDVRISRAKGKVADGPGYDPELTIDRAYLDTVYDHYDVAPYWGAEYANPGYPYYPAMHGAR